MSTGSFEIDVSGLYSGPSPSAGIGIAKSIRSAFPKAQICGIDYFEGSSGLHHSTFDEVIVLPSWDIIQHDVHAKTMIERLQTKLFLSSLDIEISWISSHIDHHRNLLIPDESALKVINKQANLNLSDLGVLSPKLLDCNRSDEEIFDFLRRSSFRVWIKGKYHGAFFCSTWRHLQEARASLLATHTASEITLQSHIRGTEYSICFAAYNGKLLEAISMQKRVMTEGGKTWAGEVSPVSDDLKQKLAHLLHKIKWTGGGEIELIRDGAERDWFVEWNPRFPAWIYGATLSGYNLPGKLVGEATGLEPHISKSSFPQFIRVVEEIPAKPGIPLPLTKVPGHGQVVVCGKYGAGFETLVNTSKNKVEHTKVSEEFEAVLKRDFQETTQTPKRVLLENYTKGIFEKVGEILNPGVKPKLTVSYSIKTSPYDEYLDLAIANGMGAEAISMSEVERALAKGWPANEIILNGPAKWWPLNCDANPGLKAVFVESIEELGDLIASKRHDGVWGVRLKLPGFQSRFGIDLSSPEIFDEMCGLIQRIPADIKFGLHFHLGSSLIGSGHWQDALNAVVVAAQAIQESTGRIVKVLDLGGGHHPRDFFKIDWDFLRRSIGKILPSVDEIVLEPGRALTQETMVMHSRVVQVRKSEDVLILDTCISDLPLINVYPHRFYHVAKSKVTRCGPGSTKVYGRVCMEDDILSSGIDIPVNIKVGDSIIIADAGAYERSMSYEFGRGSC